MRLLKKSTAANVMVFLTMSSDHVTGLTGATLAVTASKNGAAFASIAPVVTERGNGWYSAALTAAHTDTLGDLALHITALLADAVDIVAQVVAVDYADAVGFGLTNLDAAASAIKTQTDKIGTTAADSTNVTGIKTKTDSLTFTKAGEVDANIQSVNDVTVTGVGTAGSPWGP